MHIKSLGQLLQEVCTNDKSSKHKQLDISALQYSIAKDHYIANQAGSLIVTFVCVVVIISTVYKSTIRPVSYYIWFI